MQEVEGSGNADEAGGGDGCEQVMMTESVQKSPSHGIRGGGDGGDGRGAASLEGRLVLCDHDVWH